MDNPGEITEEDRRRHAELHKDEGCVVHGSKETPIVVEERRHDAGQYISWEYAEIQRQIGTAKQVIQSIKVGPRVVDRVMVETPAGAKHVFYFDVTEPFMCMEALLADPKHPCPHVKPVPPTGEKRTRHAVVWNPAFEAGLSRVQIIQGIKMAWGMKAPQLVDRRGIELRDTSHAEVLRRCGEWLSKTWGKTLVNRKRLSVIVITDPLWEEDLDKFKLSVQAMQNGYNYGVTKPQFVVLDVISEERI